MKKYTTKVQCRGCKADITFGFECPKVFGDRDFPAKCNTCESEILIQIKQGLMVKQLLSRVKLIKHSDKLLSLLEERRAHA